MDPLLMLRDRCRRGYYNECLLISARRLRTFLDKVIDPDNIIQAFVEPPPS
jgi:hypothetical protein